MRFLRTNTAVIVTVGPFYDKTDGVTIETALTITNERLTLTADTDAGSAPTNILDNIAGATAATANDLNYITGNDAGMMQLELASADVNRLGRMFLSITDAANHVPVFHEFMVVNAALYDAFFASSGGAIPNVVAGAAGGVFIAGANAATSITTALTANIVGNITGDLSGSVGSVTGAVGSVTGAVGSVTGDVGGNVNGGVAGNVNGSVGSIGTAGISVASFATGAITSTAIAANAIGASELAADAVTEIQSGLATAAALTTAQTDISAILVDTAEIGAAGAGLTAINLPNQTMDIVGNITGNLSGSVGSVTGAVGSVTGAVGSVTGAVGSVGAGGIAAASFAAGAIDAAAIAANAIGASELAADAVAEIADAIWDEDATGHQTGGTFGQAIGDPVADTATIYAAVVTNAAGVDVAADIIAVKADTAAILVDTGTTLDGRIPAALVGGRIDASVGAMAAGVVTAAAVATGAIDADAIAADAVTEIQAGLATPTNITGGVITTVTNLTNAPTAGDFTATMKASVNAEVVDTLATDTYAEPTAPPAATATLAAKINWLGILARNKITQTATTQLVKADDGTTTVGTSTVSDDGTTASRNEFT